MGALQFLKLYRANLALLAAIFVVAIGISDEAGGLLIIRNGMIGLLIALFAWINAAAVVRRLHDFSKSGYWCLLYIPAVFLGNVLLGSDSIARSGAVVLVLALPVLLLVCFFSFARGTVGANPYGDDPYGR
jgi:uncharacterized membrane protein YhaH (DUF805 family)